MRESDLLSHIARVTAELPRVFPHVLVPPGDDCAAIRSPAGDTLLLKVDQVIEGKHFVALADPRWSRNGLTRDAYLDLIARKAVARPLSDIAAMAGRPLSALAAVCTPANFPADAARVLADAVHRWGAHWSCPIVGGDVSTSITDAPLSIGVTVLGVAGRTLILRSGARPGDGVYVTGAIGGSLNPDGLGRHLTFEPRLREAGWLAAALGDSLYAMIDISDGLGLDAARLAHTSGVALVLDEHAIPLTPGRGLAQAIADGEDYELLFTANAAPPPRCPDTGCPITRIGAVEPGTGAWLRRADGARTDIAGLGYEHA